MNRWLIFGLILAVLIISKGAFATLTISTSGTRIDFIGDDDSVGDCDVYAFNLYEHAYVYETDGSYPMPLTTAFINESRVQYYNTSYVDITEEANNGTAEDFSLPPLNSTGNGTMIYIGTQVRSPNGITINITTSGVGAWNITCARSTGTSTWGAVTCTDGTNAFRNSGVNDITFSLQPTTRGTVNGISAFWYRINITNLTSLTTYPMASQIWIRYSTNNQPRPWDWYYTPIIINVTNYTSAGTLMIFGQTATAETSEIIDINNSDGTYTSYQKYSSLSIPAFKASGNFSWQALQTRAGALSMLETGTGDNKQYYLYGKPNVSSNPNDGSYRTCWAETDKYIYLRSGSTTTNFIVNNNSEVDFGFLDDAIEKTTSYGVYVTGLSTNDYINILEGGKINWYGGGMVGGRFKAYNATVYNVKFDNVQLKQCINCDMFRNTFSGSSSYINPEGAFSGTFDHNRFIGTVAVMFMSRYGTSNLHFTNTYVRSRTGDYDIGLSGIGSNPIYNTTFTDNDYDEWAINPTMAYYEPISAGWNLSMAWIFEDYTNTLNVRYPNGTSIDGAVVDVTPLNDGLYAFNSTLNVSTAQMCYILNSTSTTDANGNWSAVMLYMFSRANSTINMQNINCRYKFNITSGNLTYSFNDTIQNGHGVPHKEIYLNATSGGTSGTANIFPFKVSNTTYIAIGSLIGILIGLCFFITRREQKEE